MKSFIIGARGLVGSAIAKKLPDALCGIPVEPKEKNQVYADVTKYETLFKVFSAYRPDTVYLCAAIAHVDKCETSMGTDVVNVDGAQTVLHLCEQFNSKLVYFSSSYVFDGERSGAYREIDDPSPINYYGQQKVEVENAILSSYVNSLVVRTVGVFGTERLNKNFAKQVVSTVFREGQVYAPSDQFMNPILSDDLANVVLQLVNKKYEGLIHVAGDTCLSKYQFAVEIAKNFLLDKLIVPVKTSEMNQKAKRPRNGCLDCSHLFTLGISVPSFYGGLVRFMSMEYA
jgi:dTDP-4-dehydrorhamnose reductase